MEATEDLVSARLASNGFAILPCVLTAADVAVLAREADAAVAAVGGPAAVAEQYGCVLDLAAVVKAQIPLNGSNDDGDDNSEDGTIPAVIQEREAWLAARHAAFGAHRDRAAAGDGRDGDGGTDPGGPAHGRTGADVVTEVLAPLVARLVQGFARGAAVRLVNDQFVVKPAVGPSRRAAARSAFPVHCDCDALVTDPDVEMYVSLWIALDDISLTNGPLVVLPRAMDRARAARRHALGVTAKLRETHEAYAERAEDGDGVPVLVAAGGGVLMACCTPHHSLPSEDSHRARRAFLPQFAIGPRPGRTVWPIDVVVAQSERS
jgi:hypothetical protein